MHLIWDSSIFSSITPKHDKPLIVYFCVFPHSWIYLFCAKNCSEHQNKTIFSAKQVNSSKNGEKHKIYQTISCHVWLDLRKYVSYSLSCITKYNHFLGVCWFLTKNISNFETLLGNLTTHIAIMATTKSWELSYTVTEASFHLFVCLCAALLKPARVLLALGGT